MERKNGIRTPIMIAMLFISITLMANTSILIRPGKSSGAVQVEINPTDWWPMFHHDLTHTGYSTSTAPPPYGYLWSYKTGGYVDSSPAVDRGLVYVGSYDDDVYALNATTGALVWKYKTGGHVESSPAVSNGVVFVGSDDYYVYALNALTGTLVWKDKTGGEVSSSPAVANGVVYVGSYDDNVYALNAANGALKWRFLTGDYLESSPAVANGFVYVGSDDGNVYALNAANGAQVWFFLTGGPVYSSPTVAGGFVYVGSADDNVYALNAANGALVWFFLTGAAVLYSSTAVTGNVVYVGSADDNVYALNAANGAQVWSFLTGNSVLSSPAVAGGAVFVGSDDDEVYALNAVNGAFMWSWLTGNMVSSSPAVAAGAMYVGSDDGYVYAFGPLPLFVSISPPFSVMDAGQSQTFIPLVSGGTIPYSYQWYLNGAPVPGATDSMWTFAPSSSGSYTVYLQVTDATGQVATSSNAPVSVNGPLSVTVSPTTVTMGVGQSQVFNSSVSGGTNPYSYQWYLNRSPVSGANNPTWTFTPTSNGSYIVVVNVTDSVGMQATSNPATVTANNGNIHDVAVTSVTSFKTVVFQGYTMNINVTAADPGNYTETFNLTVYVNTSYVTSQVVTLNSGNSTTLTLTWNTTGFAKGIYTISAYAWPVPGEANTVNNNFTGGSVYVSMVGDLTGATPFVPDGKCDGRDITAVAKCFGSQLGDARYNPNCDILNRGRIDGRDITIVAKNFGKQDP